MFFMIYVTDKKSNAEVEVKIGSMFKKLPDIGKRLHEVIMQANPFLNLRLWYGIPGYARSESTTVVCFIREDKYVTFGVTESANLELVQGELNEVSWFLTSLNKQTEEKIAEIVKSVSK